MGWFAGFLCCDWLCVCLRSQFRDNFLSILMGLFFVFRQFLFYAVGDLLFLALLLNKWRKKACLFPLVFGVALFFVFTWCCFLLLWVFLCASYAFGF